MEEKKVRLQDNKLEKVVGGAKPIFYTVTCDHCGKADRKGSRPLPGML